MLECPLGKLLKPSFSCFLSLTVQTALVTRTSHAWNTPPRELFTMSSTFDQSGWHLVTRSGRGLPTMFFSPSVMNIASAMDMPRPRRARFRFTSLRFVRVSLVSGEKAEDVEGARRQKQ